jgi:hypothetical protein
MPRHRSGTRPLLQFPAPAARAADPGLIPVTGQANAGMDIGAAADHPEWPRKGNKVHTMCTSNGSPYTNFQNRIMYGTYKLAQTMPGGDVLAAFTRILHRSVNDEVMQVRLEHPAHFCFCCRYVDLWT